MGVGLDILYGTTVVLTSPVWVTRMLRSGKWRTDWRARLGNAQTHDGQKHPHPGPLPPPEKGERDRPCVLIHAVSVGEVNAIRALVRRIHERTNGRWRIVISTTTDTGTARARSLFEPAHRVVRFPLDFSCSVRRLLDSVKPNLVALAELEVWPNFVSECDRRGIRVCVVNGRLSARSFKRYRIVAPILRSTFHRLAHAAVQTQDYAQRFIAMGVPANRVSVTDTMKWDTAQIAEPEDVPGVSELALAMGIDRTRPVIVAGSTGPGEEKLLIETCPAEAQLILVPRKPERFDEVAAMPEARGIVRRTEHPDGTTRTLDGQKLFLLDTMGELRKAYALADVAIVGRSFLGLYGSDPIESIALGKPTILGPHHSDFADSVAAFVAGEGIVISDKPGPAAADLLQDRVAARALAERGRKVILSRQGATERHADLLLKLMPERVG